MDRGQCPVMGFGLTVHVAFDGFSGLQVLRVGGIDDEHGDLDTLLNTLGSAHETEFIVR